MVARFHLGLLGAILEFGTFCAIAQGSERMVGVPEAKQSLYEAKDGKWACLSDPSVVIDASQINDGMCDCPDGSDEPGTGACGMDGPQFFCENEGFMPRYISQSKVGDGVCDCCDCSDEKLTQGEVFYRGAECRDLKLSFDNFVETELKTYETAIEVLRNIKSKAGSYDEEAPKSKEELSEEIRTLSEEVASTEKILEGEKFEYWETLKEENPLLYEFEQLHVGDIASSVTTLFTDIIRVSKAYEELVKIMDGLVENYSRNLKDLVVDENVKKYQFYKLHSLSELSCDSKSETEQREQLMTYFHTELPKLFLNGLSDRPAKYIEGKATFVDMLILSKAEYTEVVMEAVEKLRAIMQDITDNYNRNYQDQFVKQAAGAFKKYTDRYLSVGVVRVSQQLADDLEHLRAFVSSKAPELVTLADSDKTAHVDPNGFMNQVQNWAQEIPKFFKPDMREQLEKHERALELLKDEISNKRKELSTAVQDEETVTDEKTRAVKTLVEKTSPYVEKALDGYVYEIHFNGQIFQRATFGDQSRILIGNFKNLHLNDDSALEKYEEYVRINYSGEDELEQHLVSETDNHTENYLFGNLYQLNNGLELEFNHGHKCWDGPERSATVFVQCSEKDQIKKITETSRCRYAIELASPFGCSETFSYQPFVLQ